MKVNSNAQFGLTRQELHDIRWLISDDAVIWLDRCRSDLQQGVDTLKMLQRLRQQISVGRSRLVVEQSELRNRARHKFHRHDQMFFTAKGLQQATSENLATYKSNRFKSAIEVADLCCGIGGDLIAFSESYPTTAVDRDSVSCLFAMANCQVCARETGPLSVQVKQADIADVRFAENCSIHIDPDRRPADIRTVDPEHCEPRLDQVTSIIARHPHVALKLAPAAKLNFAAPVHLQREWIGDPRESKQQVCWFGDLIDGTHARVATVVGDSGEVLSQYGGYCPVQNQIPLDADISSEIEVNSYIYDVHSTLIASGLFDQFARQFGLKRVSPAIAYLIGSKISHGLAARFRIMDSCAADRKRIESMLRSFDIGDLEFKCRGIDLATQHRYAKLKLLGTQRRTLFITRRHSSSIAILAEREVE